MNFWLGTHMPSWLEQVDVGLMVSHRRLLDRRRLPRALGPWVLDSGGFTELSMFGEWQTTPTAYVAAVRRYADEIGNLEWAAPQDWMCEPFMLERTGLDVAEHQRRTIANLVELRTLAPDLPFVPVLQGWTLDDYLNHADAYTAAGIDLVREFLVGLGSVCRRQGTAEIARIVCAFTPLRLHGFGMKARGITRIRPWLTSADSLAWSLRGRHTVCTHGAKTCANCLPFALAWRRAMLERRARHGVQLVLGEWAS